MVRTRSDRFWLAGLVWALLYFVTFEGQAYRTHNPAATLTYYVRFLLGIEPRNRRRFILAPIMWLFCLWLPVHFQYNTLGIPVKR